MSDTFTFLTLMALSLILTDIGTRQKNTLVALIYFAYSIGLWVYAFQFTG